MKKIIAIVLLAAMVLGLCACGTINENDVAVLWSGADKAQIPNSLINAMDRAMYIENIAYTYYGAEGDAVRQLEQAQQALDAGCTALMVELVDAASAQRIVDLAKAKNVPVIFFGCDVDETVTAGYDKCVVVNTDESTLPKVQGEMIAEYLKKNAEDLDRNSDGKISYVNMLAEELEIDTKEVEQELERLDVTEVDPATVEMVITGDDITALGLLVELQGKGYNTDKLVTHYVAIFTVGNEADYKAYVLESAPAGEKELKAHYEDNKYLVDLTTVEKEDLDAMIYTTANVIDAGRIAGTAMEDYDAIAVAAAEACAALITGKGVEKSVIDVSYTTYTG